MANQYRVCIIGCGRMGGTIDEEVKGGRHPALPYSHAAGYTAYERTTIVAASDVVEEKGGICLLKMEYPQTIRGLSGDDRERETRYRQRSNPSGTIMQKSPSSQRNMG